MVCSCPDAWELLPDMDKQEIVHILEEIGTLLELQGESPFKSRAYTTGARVIAGLDTAQLQDLARSGKLRSLKGIGIALAEKIGELMTTGQLPYYETLKQQVPGGLLEMLTIPGMGPKKVKAIYDQLSITTVGELEYACHENRLVDLPGFGRKTQENIIKGIDQLKQHRGQYLCHEAMQAVRPLYDGLMASELAARVALAGSLRRRQETIEQIDLVVSTTEEERLRALIAKWSLVGEVLINKPSHLSLHLQAGVKAGIHLVDDMAFPFALHALTGNQAYLTAIQAYAGQHGYLLAADGLRRGHEQMVCHEEEAIFAALGLSYIPPELREGLGEIEAAAHGALPRLIDEPDIQGVFHVHSTWSDGMATIEEMAHTAQGLGYRYLGLSDHSQSARYANGLDPDRVREQHRLIDRLNTMFDGLTILKGSEVDILPDGSLDYPDDLLTQMDFVVASVHSRFNMPEAEMTSRIIKAVHNPYVTMIGHLTGRLLLAREGYALDVEAVIAEAMRLGVIIELNANPHRLDLDWRHLRAAHTQGLLTCINPDAHSPDGLRHVTYGVGIARKGGLAAERVLNTRGLQDIQNWLAERRAARLGS
jgi:DNA polymerase (family 10)